MFEYIIDHMDHDFTITQSFKPESLRFTLNDEGISTIAYQISGTAVDLDGDPVITGDDFISPQNTHFRLRYGASIIIMAGIHTSVEMEYGQPYMSVSGSDWLWYFDKRFQPFDGRVDHAYDNVISSPAQGLYYEKASVDIATALTDILDSILGMTNSIPITYSLSSTGVVMDHYRVALADSTTLLSIVTEICNYNPGRAFEIRPGRTFHISDDERWYGHPDDVAAGDDTNPVLVWVVNDDNPPLGLTFGNSGPAETHLFGEGAGTSTRTVVTVGNVANQEVYWRTDRQIQFADAITRDSVEARTTEQLAFDLNPVHNIPLKLDPDQVDKQYAVIQGHDPGDDDGFFWDTIKPGRALWIDLQLIAHHIDSPHHIVSMDATVKDNGVTEVDLSLNQIYDVTAPVQVHEP